MTTIDLATCLATIPDRRRAEGKMYGQVGVILFSIIAMVSGARSYRQIQALIKTRLGLLDAAYPTIALRRAPAYTCVRGILQGIDPNDLEQAFRRHADGLDRACSDAPSRFIAIDGKTLRQSFDAFADRKAAHVLSAFAVDHKIILVHEVVDDKSNEIPAAQTLIAAMGLAGRVFTLDAMHCQKTIQIARETSNEVIVQVKANQPNLLHGLEQIVATSTPLAVHDSCDRARNRREDRPVHVYDTAAALKGTEGEPLVAMTD